MKKYSAILKIGLVVLALLTSLLRGHGQGTTFNYQGRLDNQGEPANGLYDLVFALYTNDAGGFPLSAPLIKSAMNVTNGLFTTFLDFGAGIFRGQPCWLEIGVRPAGGEAFNPLTPRQPVRPAPYAMFADAARSLAGPVSTEQLSGLVNNNQLQSNSITISPGVGLSGGGTTFLGGQMTLTNTGVLSVLGLGNLLAQTKGGAVYLGDNGTSLNTPSTLVARDATGGFSASGITLNGLLNIGTPGGSVGVGQDSLVNNTDGRANTGVGFRALWQTTTGGANTAVGFEALQSNNGQANSALGVYALRLNTTGCNNSAFGNGAGFYNLSGSNNTAMGNYALFYNTSANNNTAIGASAMFANSTGNDNSALGFSALSANTIGTSNSALGSFALYSNTIGSNNTALGTLAMFSTTSGSRNSALGHGALYSNITGNNNTACGYEALSYNTTGSFNLGLGYGSLYANTSGSFNSACGGWALNNNQSGSYNTASGFQALIINGTGSYDTATGSSALFRNTTGSYNTAGGYQSLYSNTTGNNNTALGNGALYANSVGSNNIALGHLSGSNVTGSFTICIGNKGAAGEGGTIRIGEPSIHGATFLSGTVFANGFAVTSDRNAKENFQEIDSLAILEKVAALPVSEWQYRTNADKGRHIGPMAQDFAAAFRLNGGDDRHLSVVDEGGVALAAIQGLNRKLESAMQSRETQIQRLTRKMEEKDSRLEALERQLNEMKQIIQKLAEK